MWLLEFLEFLDFLNFRGFCKYFAGSSLKLVSYLRRFARQEKIGFQKESHRLEIASADLKSSKVWKRWNLFWAWGKEWLTGGWICFELVPTGWERMKEDGGVKVIITGISAKARVHTWLHSLAKVKVKKELTMKKWKWNQVKVIITGISAWARVHTWLHSLAKVKVKKEKIIRKWKWNQVTVIITDISA